MLEIGLHLTSVIYPPPSAPQNAEVEDPLDTAPGEFISPALIEVGTPIACSFEITHKAPAFSVAGPTDSDPNPTPRSRPRPRPRLDSVIIKRLLSKTGTTLTVTEHPNPVGASSAPGWDTTYALSTQFVCGPTPSGDPLPPSLFIEDDEGPLGVGSSPTMNTHPSSNPYSLPLAQEPTLEELATFSETALRGKRAVFHARESSAFARHLTSYLTSWGLDVGHVPIGLGDGVTTVPGAAAGGMYPDLLIPPLAPTNGPSNSVLKGAGTADSAATMAVLDPTSGLLSPGALSDSGAGGSLGLAGEAMAAGAASSASPPTTEGGGGVPPSAPIEPSFVIIDDDVDVLRRILNRYRPEVAAPKRPSLALYHRPRSSPQIRNVLGLGANPPSGGNAEKRTSNLRTMLDTSSAGGDTPPATASGLPPSNSSPYAHAQPLPSPNPTAHTLPPTALPPALGPPSPNIIIVHITSLGHYKHVKDTVQSALFLVPPSRMPDIIVVPKPAGPRRFLTALYTAVRRPMVDPWFSPIATSPQSPGGVPPVSSSLSMYSSGSGSERERSSSGREGTRKMSSGARGSGSTSPTATRQGQMGGNGAPTAGNSPGDWVSFCLTTLIVPSLNVHSR